MNPKTTPDRGPVTRDRLAEEIKGLLDTEMQYDEDDWHRLADAILAKYIVLPKAVQPERPKRELLTEPHNGHPVDESCPGCPHEQPKLDPEPYVRSYDGLDTVRMSNMQAKMRPLRFENDFGEVVVTRFDPRPEYDQNEAHYNLEEI